MTAADAPPGPAVSAYTAANAEAAAAAAADANGGSVSAPARAAGLSGLHGKGVGAATTAAEMARLDSVRLGDEPRRWGTTARDGAPAHPLGLYAHREPPVDPRAWAGRALDAGTGSKGGALSAVVLGDDAPVYQSEAMAAGGQGAGDFRLRPAFVPEPPPRPRQ
jgi:hypothetical protein